MASFVIPFSDQISSIGTGVTHPSNSTEELGNPPSPRMSCDPASVGLAQVKQMVYVEKLNKNIGMLNY